MTDISEHPAATRAGYLRSAVVGTSLVVALAGCGSTDSGAPEPAQEASEGDSSSSSEAPRTDREQITPGGIAAIVSEHFGPAAVRRFFTFEAEAGSVVVSVRLSDTGPHQFLVYVNEPQRTRASGGAGQCPSEPAHKGEWQCRTLEDGTIIVTRVEPEGFTDGNEDGMVITAGAVSPEGGSASAWFESFDGSPAVSPAGLADLLAHPQLTWLTEPAVNEAGEDIDVRFID